LEPLRIALLSWESVHSIHVGGLGNHVSELAAALSRAGHDVHVFTRRVNGQAADDRIDGVHYHRCAVPGHDDFIIYTNGMCDAFIHGLGLAEQTFARRFDVIHGHDWLAARALVRAKNELDRPVVLTMHSTEYGRCGNELYDGMSARIRHMEWEGLYVANHVICVSRSLANEINGLYSVPYDKMTVIYNGVDVRRFDVRVNRRRVRTECRVGLDDPMVLFAGRMARQKGPDLLIEAIPGVLARVPRARFVFAGDGDMRPWLEHRVAERNLGASVRFLGYRSGRALVDLFKTADTVCVPSRNEPFGIVVLEAWGAARPVIATRSGGPGEFVRDRETGLVVAPDAGQLGHALSAVLQDPTDGRRMGDAGRAEAESRFSWDTIARQTLAEYGHVLGREVMAVPPPVAVERLVAFPKRRAAGTAGRQHPPHVAALPR
jgi:glycosyltransferase involved in cell wall biosynthesis